MLRERGDLTIDNAGRPENLAPKGHGRAFRPGLELAGLGLGLVLIVAWPFVLSRFQAGDVYAVMGPFAIAVIVMLALLGAKLRVDVIDRRHLLRNVGIGLVVGVVMTALTYVAYAIAVRVMPSLAGHVSSLYAGSQSERMAPALAWTIVILLAEEMLWRGALLRVVERRTSRGVALSLSLGSYVLAQSGSGSVIVALAALLCGAIWLAEREWTGSIVAPLVSHLIWTPIVIHLYPVTGIHQ